MWERERARLYCAWMDGCARLEISVSEIASQNQELFRDEDDLCSLQP